jgi:hypothetical protein
MSTRSRVSFLIVALLSWVIPIHGSSEEHDSIYLRRDEFMYADDPRYTFLGGTPRRESEIQLWPTVGMTAAYATIFTALHIHQKNLWWSETGEFRIIEDVEYARGLDKVGHIFAGYTMSTFSADLLMECGLSQRSAVWTGAGAGLAFTLYVEINDGFAKDWGFSPSDLYSDLTGIAFYVSQEYVPWLQNFTPRWSYIPPTWTGDQVITGRPFNIIDDYNGTTFWLACNVNNLLPVEVEAYWPDWLMFSVGYGIRNYNTTDENGLSVQVHRRFLFGLDYNWVKIIPESSIGFFNYLRQALNHIRLPGPTLEIGDDGVAFGIFYPFAIVVPL